MALKLKPIQLTMIKVMVHLLSIGLLARTYYQGFSDQLGADPVEAILHFTGIGAFNLLLLSLTITPLAKITKQPLLIRTRRLIGLYALCYALCHFISYIVFELQFAWSLLLSEIIKRPYITVGFVALVILVLLGSTSTQAIQRRMKGTWQSLHNWVYMAGFLVALHFIWSVKSNLVEPLIYWAILLFLLYFRLNKFKRLIKRIKNRQQNLSK